MKKIYNLLLMLAMTSCFVACTQEVDDVFDKSSADRMTEAITNTKDVLCSAPNGWHVEYYGSLQYGGYHMFCTFDKDNNVTAINEIYGAAESETSHYTLLQSQGVLLSFDTYNPIFHFFSDPENAAGVGDNGKGMLGDFEFRVLTCRPDSVILLGKKHGAKIVMTPAAADVNIGNFFDAVTALEENLGYSKFALTVGEKVYDVKNSYRQLTATDPETGNATDLPYIVTENSIKFYKPVTLGDQVLTEMTFSNDVWNEVNNSSIVLTPVIPPLSEQIVGQAWYFGGENISAAAYPYFNKAVEGSASEGEEIAVMFIGPASEITMFQSRDYSSQFALTFISNGYAGALNFNVTAVDENTVTLTFAGTAQGDGVYYYNIGYNYVVSILGGTYKLTTDNIKAPTWIRMEKTDNPDIYWTLTADYILYPFSAE